jgi:GNAT superfamily N-acetyltransferase
VISNNLTIRLATLNDAPALVRLAEQLGYKRTNDELQAVLPRILNDTNTGLFVGEFKPQSPIAFMQISVRSTLISGMQAELNSFIVDSSHREKGIGRKLIQFAEDWARKKDLNHIRLGTAITRTDAHMFYDRLGFTNEKSSYIFGKSL